MRACALLALGITLLVCALAVATFVARSQPPKDKSGIWLRVYFGLLVASVVTTGLLLMSNLFVRLFSVNAYRNLFDGLSLALVGTLSSGLILVIRRPRYLPGYFMFLCGAIITFGEFFGR
jgi:hypothetical protein